MKPQLTQSQAEALHEEGAVYAEKFQFKEAITLFEKARKYYKTKKEWKTYLEIYHKIAGCWMQLGQKDTSIQHCQEILQIIEEHELPYYGKTAEIFALLANLYSGKRQFDTSYRYVQSGIEIAEKHLHKNHSILIGLYQELGSIFLFKTDYGRALRYFQKCLPINIKQGHPYSIALNYYRIGECFQKMQNFEEAIAHFEISIDSHEKENCEKNIYIAITLSNIGGSYISLGMYETALIYLEKSLKQSLESFGDTHPAIGLCFKELGGCYSMLNQPKLAIEYYQKSLEVSKKVYGLFHINVALLLHFIGLCYNDLQDFETATIYSQKALACVLKNEELTDIYTTKFFIDENAPHKLLPILCGKAQNLFDLYHQKLRLKDLLAALQTAQWAMQIIRAIRQSYKDELSKLHLAKDNQKLSDILLEFLRQIHTIQHHHIQNTSSEIEFAIPKELKAVSVMSSVFEVMEQNNAILLLTHLKNKYAQIVVKIPQELRNQESKLRKKLAQLETNILQKENNQNSNSPQQLIDEKAQFANLQLQYTELIQKFETDYPQYYQLKHQVEIVPLENLQQKLPSDTALIEYFIGEKYLYTFVITSNDTQFLQSAKPDDFEELIEAFKTSIDEIDKTEYTELAFELYQLLIHPLTPNESLITSSQSPVTSLKIIPSGILSTIPFEALLTKKVQGNAKYANLPYLLLQYDISYHYSVTLWSQSMDAERVEIRPTFVGFAPVYKSEQEQTLEESITRGIYNEDTTRSVRIGEEIYSELVYSEEEVTSIESYFNAKNIPTQTFLHAQANSNNFLQNVGKHKYILISAHGFYNEKQPDLTGIILSPDDVVSAINEDMVSASFSNVAEPMEAENSPSSERHGGFSSESENKNIFYLSDAYNLELNADLVVLNCCETGVGKLAKGEGVMALNRGFFYAGAKNVIYTLFKVYDQASCQLTKHLFQQILKSKPYALALKEAKRQLILQGKAPIHWAGYLLIGE